MVDSITGRQQSKTSQPGKRAIQLAGSADEGSSGWDLIFFVLFAGNGGAVFEPVASAGNGNGLGVVQETIQDRARRGHRTRQCIRSKMERYRT
jgi:hypothetical protein